MTDKLINEKPADAPEGAKLDKNGVWRNKNGHILPGQVNNPKGRAMDENAKRFKELAQSMAEDCLNKLFNIVQDPKEETKDQIRAADIIMDRAYGKPTPVKVEDEGEVQYQPRPIIIGDITNLMKKDQDITDSGEQVKIDEE
jgi:hypothetical protein